MEQQCCLSLKYDRETMSIHVFSLISFLSSSETIHLRRVRNSQWVYTCDRIKKYQLTKVAGCVRTWIIMNYLFQLPWQTITWVTKAQLLTNHNLLKAWRETLGSGTHPANSGMTWHVLITFTSHTFYFKLHRSVYLLTIQMSKLRLNTSARLCSKRILL